MKKLLLLFGFITLITAFQIQQDISDNQKADCPLYFEQMQQELESGMNKWDFQGPQARAQFKQLLKICKSEAKSCEERMVSAVLLRIEYGLSHEPKFDRQSYQQLYRKTIDNCHQIFNSHIYQNQEICHQFFEYFKNLFETNQLPELKDPEDINEFLLNFDQCENFAITCQEQTIQQVLNSMAQALMQNQYDTESTLQLYYQLLTKCQAYVLQILRSDLMIDEQKCHELFEIVRYSKNLEQTIEGLYGLSKEEKEKCVKIYENPKSCSDFTAVLLLKELQQKDLNLKVITQSVKDHYQTCSKSIYSHSLQQTPEPLAAQECQKFELWIGDQTIKSEENFDCEIQSDNCAKLYAYNQPSSTLQKKAEDHAHLKEQYLKLCTRRNQLLAYFNYGVQSCSKLISTGTIYLSLPSLNLPSFASCAPELRFIKTHAEEQTDSSTLGLDVEGLQKFQEYHCNITDQAYLNKLQAIPAPQFQLNSLVNKNCHCEITSDSRTGSVSGLRFNIFVDNIRDYQESTYNDIFYGLQFQGCKVEVLRNPLLSKAGDDFILEVHASSLSSSLLQFALSILLLLALLF